MVTGIAVDSRKVLVIPRVFHANTGILDVVRYNKVIEVVHWVAKKDSKWQLVMHNLSFQCDIQH